MEFLREYAAENQCSLYEALSRSVGDGLFKGTQAQKFLSLIEGFASDYAERPGYSPSRARVMATKARRRSSSIPGRVLVRLEGKMPSFKARFGSPLRRAQCKRL